MVAMVLAITTTNLMSTLRTTLMIRVCLLLVIRRGLVLCPMILTTGMLMKWTTPCIHGDNAFNSSDDASYSSSSPGSSDSLALDDISLLCLSPGEGAFIRRAAIK